MSNIPNPYPVIPEDRRIRRPASPINPPELQPPDTPGKPSVVSPAIPGPETIPQPGSPTYEPGHRE